MNDLSYQPIKSFKFWCQTVLPTVYDDSLSYYELLNKVVNSLNDVIDSTNNVVVSLFEPYSSEKSYSPGDYCWNKDKLYKCLTANAGTWNNNDWEAVVFTDDIGERFKELKEYVTSEVDIQRFIINILTSDVAPNYYPENTYNPGDYVIKEYQLYKCINQTTGVFNELDWQAVTVVSEVEETIDNLWDTFLDNYLQTLGVVQTLGSSVTDVISQNAVTLELLRRVKSMGVYTGESLADIEAENSLYALTYNHTYSDYPFGGQTSKNGIVLSLKLYDTSMWAQIALSWGSSTASTDDIGMVAVRTGISRAYSNWIFPCIRESEVDHNYLWAEQVDEFWSAYLESHGGKI